MAELGPDEHDRKWEQLNVGKPLFSGRDATWRGATEYGGVDGLIQPSPHDPGSSAYEQLLLIRNMDPAARGEEPDAVQLPAGLVEPELAKWGKGLKPNLGTEVKVDRTSLPSSATQ